MAHAAYASLLLINPAHTGGQDLASDILLPDELLEPLCHAVNDDGDLWGELADDDPDYDRAVGALWTWRKPRLRKG